MPADEQSVQSVALRRRRYTGETFQQAHRAIKRLTTGAAPIPTPQSPAQERLEARVLLNLLEYRNLYTRYPLGIEAVQPTPDGIALRVESVERAAEILFALLPAHAPGEEVHGLPGLRIVNRLQSAIELQVLNQPTQLRLRGLPASLWHRAEQIMLTKWIDPDAMQLCWRTAPKTWTSAEREHMTVLEDDSEPFIRRCLRGSWLGSALLRRAALFHTVANTYFVDGYRGLGLNAMRWVMRSSHAPQHGPGAQHLVAALLDPVYGVPLRLIRFRGDTDESSGSDQHFVLEDSNKTARLELHASVERPSEFLNPELWKAILRRIPAALPANGLPHAVTISLGNAG
ncbi:hypothetical protein [Streptomyces sp. MNP-20]|uniref:hypothetical protein n=1 Tax=Streptomyces sp. MNP-20 TaxID=2721165 RepID=UPI0015559EFE|nr:hypothetical protein [Streptomyces sp. MNP-20]